MKIWNCLKCGGNWVSRQDLPKRCGICKTWNWNKQPPPKAWYVTLEVGRSHEVATPCLSDGDTDFDAIVAIRRAVKQHEYKTGKKFRQWNKLGDGKHWMGGFETFTRIK